ncbi:MAG: hypothetical protein NW215_07515 [Hyphomicrobiales bacterium]|nr:hypothetical protein [Hyphomicrobiales bacterium]
MLLRVALVLIFLAPHAHASAGCPRTAQPGSYAQTAELDRLAQAALNDGARPFSAWRAEALAPFAADPRVAEVAAAYFDAAFCRAARQQIDAIGETLNALREAADGAAPAPAEQALRRAVEAAAADLAAERYEAAHAALAALKAQFFAPTMMAGGARLAIEESDARDASDDGEIVLKSASDDALKPQTEAEAAPAHAEPPKVGAVRPAEADPKARTEPSGYAPRNSYARPAPDGASPSVSTGAPRTAPRSGYAAPKPDGSASGAGVASPNSAEGGGAAPRQAEAPAAAAAPPPPAAPAPQPVSDECRELGVLENCTDYTPLLAALKEKPLEYNHPKVMYQGRKTEISLVLRTDWKGAAPPDAPSDAMKGLEGEVKQGASKVTQFMSARLIGADFAIDPEGPQQRLVTTAEPVVWTWLATPTETGASKRLRLQLFAHLQTGGEVRPPVLIKTLDASIDVDVRTWDWIVSRAQTIDPIFGVLATVIGLLTAFVTVVWRRRPVPAEAVEPRNNRYLENPSTKQPSSLTHKPWFPKPPADGAGS